MKTVYKYPLVIQRRQTLSLPKGAELLSIQAKREHDELFLWALVDPTAELENRHFWLYGTGHQISDATIKYVATVQVLRGSLVWHIFEDITK